MHILEDFLLTVGVNWVHTMRREAMAEGYTTYRDAHVHDVGDESHQISCNAGAEGRGGG